MHSSPSSPAALVYAASNPIGGVLCTCLAARGWRVAWCRPESADDGDVNQDAGVWTLNGELADLVGRQSRLDAVGARLGRVDLMVCEIPPDPCETLDLLSVSEASIDQQLATSVSIPFFLAQGVGRWMIAQRHVNPEYRGRIVFVSAAPAAWGPPPLRDASVASVSATTLTKLWALRLAADGTEVYEVRSTRALDSQASSTKGQTANPAAREVAMAVSDLAAGRLSYMTGSVLTVGS